MAFWSTCTWECYCKTWNPTPSTTTPSAPSPPSKKKKKNHVRAHIHTHTHKNQGTNSLLFLFPRCAYVCVGVFFLLRGGGVVFCARTHWWLIWLINYNNKRKLSFMNAISWACESCKKMIYPQLPASIKSLAVKSLPHSPTYYPNLQIVN